MCCSFLYGFAHVSKVGFAYPIFSLREINVTFRLVHSWYGMILWVLEFNVRVLNRSERVIFSRASLSVTPHWRGLIMAKQLSTATTPLLGSFGIVLMSCKVHFHLLRSDLQNSKCIFFVNFFFCYHFTVKPWNFPDATFYGWRKFKTFVFQRPLAFKSFLFSLLEIINDLSVEKE